jgi:S1-C subfamily serine protease
METNKMSAIKNKTLGAFAAGLMAATALVATVSVLPATQAVAQNQLKADAVDPSKGFADLVDKVMPAVVSVQVKYANAAASGDEQAQGKKMPGGMEEFFKQFPQFRDMPGMPGGLLRSKHRLRVLRCLRGGQVPALDGCVRGNRLRLVRPWEASRQRGAERMQ